MQYTNINHTLIRENVHTLNQRTCVVIIIIIIDTINKIKHKFEQALITYTILKKLECKIVFTLGVISLLPV